jgi:glucokinase
VSDTPLYVGVDLGRSTRAALVDAHGAILLQDRQPTHLEGGRAVVDGLVEVVTRVVGAAGDRGRVVAIGLGVPGLVDHRAQRIEVLPNLDDVSGIDVHGELVSATGLAVVMDNDANTAAYGEWRCGAARGAQDALYVTIGTGIGAGLVLGGRLHRGARGYSGEFGHAKVTLDGLECSCGSSGCLETVASGPNIVRRARELMFAEPRFALSALAPKMSGQLACEDVVAAALTGDAFARTVLSETAQYVGMAVASAVNLLNFEMVVLGGPVLASNEYLVDEVRKEAAPRSFVPSFESCRIVASALGADAGAIGAAMLARDEAGSGPTPALPAGLPLHASRKPDREEGRRHSADN